MSTCKLASASRSSSRRESRGGISGSPRAPTRRQGLPPGRPHGRAPPPPRAGPSDVFVLDLDGTLVDSEPEVSTSALAAAARRWPHLFAALADGERARVLAGLHATRPRLVKGFEAMVMARLVLESDANVGAILADWEERLLPASLAAWGEDEGRLAPLFEEVRAAQLAGDRAAWLGLNAPYPGVAEALRDCPYPWYVVSSKGASRLVPVLNATLSAEAFAPDSPRLFAGLIPPNKRKIEALRAIAQRPVAQEAGTLHFVDDRAETLRAIVEQAPDVAERYSLYLATWGYCTPEELAAPLPGVRQLRLPEFCELLRFGLLMGVDDGCEPTTEEVLAGLRNS
eukprot:scaffold15.g4237.t1